MKKIVSLFFILLLFNASSVFAASIISNSASSIFMQEPTYNSGLDAYEYFFKDSNTVDKVVNTVYSDSSFTTVIGSGTESASAGSFFSGGKFTCNGYYDSKFYSGSTLLGELKMFTDEISNSTCSAPSGGGSVPNMDETNNLLGQILAADQSILGKLNNNNANSILSQILDSSNLNGDKLGSVVSAIDRQGGTLSAILDSSQQNGHVLGDILASSNSNGDTLGQILGEMQTTSNVGSGSVPDAPSINHASLGDFEPPSNPVFHDDSTYFTDKGDSTEIAGPLPSVPDPASCWGLICKESDMTAENTLVRADFSSDPEMTKDSFTSDPILTTDHYNKDSELAPDSFVKDSELPKDVFVKQPEMAADTQLNKETQMNTDNQLNQDTQMNTDSFSKDAQMNKDSFTSDPELSNNQNYSKTNTFEQTNFYSVTE